jgi:hypothetical protein
MSGTSIRRLTAALVLAAPPEPASLAWIEAACGWLLQAWRSATATWAPQEGTIEAGTAGPAGADSGGAVGPNGEGATATGDTGPAMDPNG